MRSGTLVEIHLHSIILPMSNLQENHLSRLKALEEALEHSKFETTSELVAQFRAEKALLHELPAVFESALEAILERLESSALFSEEACSFSQTDLVASLSVWVEKAQSYLRKQMGLVD